MRRAIALTAAVLITLLVASPAGAQANPYEGTTTGLTTTTPSPAPGGTVTVAGSGCAAGADVGIFLDGASVGTVAADSAGAFSAQVTAPTAVGSYTINAVCGDEVLGLVINVAATGTTTGAGALPTTGSDSLPLFQLAVALVAMGGLAVLFTRKRRPAEVSSGS